jgi:putative (di)nucleoside polyphosphate hydrolase
MMQDRRFRPNVAALVRIGDSFLSCRRTQPAHVWQTVQGGIESSDTDVRSALLRELREELGVDSNDVKVVAQSSVWRRYLFPAEVKNLNSKRSYIGQEQLWFLVELPSMDCIRLQQSEGEFSEVQLVELQTLIAQMVLWKLPVVKDFCYEAGLMSPVHRS